MRSLAGLMLVVCAYAQPDATKPEPPSARIRAREILDAAAEMVGAAQPEVQVAALAHLGDNYGEIDKKRALELLHQAFSAAAVLPEIHQRSYRNHLQSDIVRYTVRVNLDEAIRQLRQMVAPSDEATREIVRALVAKKDTARAIGFIGAASPDRFPWQTVEFLLERLENSEQTAQLMYRARLAFDANPAEEFGKLIGRHWRSLPLESLTAALKSYVTWVIERKNKSEYTINMASASGTAVFTDKSDYNLFYIMPALEATDPDRAKEIVQQRPLLQAALKQFPAAEVSMLGKQGDPVSISIASNQARDGARDGEARLDSLAYSRKNQALQLVGDNPSAALDMVASIPTADARGEVLSAIASSIGPADAAKARSILNGATKLLGDIKQSRSRIPLHVKLAEAHYRLQDQQGAWDAYGRAMSDVVELFGDDAHPDTPNQALREDWPSTQLGRMVVRSATRLFGVNAEPVLLKVTDPDLNLLLRIELAQALLGRPVMNDRTWVIR